MLQETLDKICSIDLSEGEKLLIIGSSFKEELFCCTTNADVSELTKMLYGALADSEDFRIALLAALQLFDEKLLKDTPRGAPANTKSPTANAEKALYDALEECGIPYIRVSGKKS